MYEENCLENGLENKIAAFMRIAALLFYCS